MQFDHKKIDKKWQERYEAEEPFKALDDSDKEKVYHLVEFPYPSGAGLHVGHVRSYTALDIVSRKARMLGKEVLYPIGWDAFGLPTENYAIKTGRLPAEVTKENIDTFRRQLKALGIGFDWSREVDTTDPNYYKWTQWMFLQFFDAGLAYKATVPINWCLSCKIGLANEEVVAGACERCGGEVEKRDKEQWMIRITDYAERLLEGLDEVDYLPQIAKQQWDWIGKSEGCDIDFVVSGEGVEEIVVATGNEAKVARVKKLLGRVCAGVKVFSISDAGLEKVEVEEDGSLVENARKKAVAYIGKTDKPVLGMDTAFYIDGEEIDPLAVKRNALGGADEKDFSQEEIAEKMHAFYRKIAEKHGGDVEAYFEDASVLIFADGSERVEVNQRAVILTSEAVGERELYFPVRNMYKVAATGKYVADSDEEDEFVELVSLMGALRNVCAPSLCVFTTRPDTLFGATYMVLAPEHPMVDALTIDDQKKVVDDYVKAAGRISDRDRGDAGREKTGVFTGAYVINPVNDEKIPVWVADYVLMGYGTGAIMAVPGHDERDWAFAKKFEIDIREVVSGGDVDEEAYVGDGEIVNSDFLDGKPVAEAKELMMERLVEMGVGRAKVNYKLRDWVFSRQRYWGEPIPLVHCEDCGWVPVSDGELPVVLPVVEKYEPTDSGESPLAAIEEWVQTSCPACGEGARRETDTMPNWAGSSWYFLRYVDARNDEEFASKEKLAAWMPVNLYNGGMEHTTLHLLYSRFWNMFLFDRGLVPTSEPYARRHSHGMVLAHDGLKMSKSKGNTVNPDEILEGLGADALRMYEMFMGPFEDAIPWNEQGLVGVRRFLDKVWRLQEKVSDSEDESVTRAVHKMVKKVGEDVDGMRFNTAVSAFMICVNVIQEAGSVTKDSLVMMLTALNPFAPHVTNEMYEILGGEGLLEKSAWPVYDEGLVVDDEVTVAVQVNGKLRGKIVVRVDAAEVDVVETAKGEENVVKFLEGVDIKKTVYVKGRLVNFVV